MIELRFKVGDVPQDRSLRLKNADGTAWDLTGRTVLWEMHLPGAQSNVVARTLVVANTVGGLVTWHFQDGDLASPGSYTNDLRVASSVAGNTEALVNFAWIVVDRT